MVPARLTLRVRSKLMRHAHIDFKPPWERVSVKEKMRLEGELAIERSLLHNLATVDCLAVARRIDSDDVLFEITPHLCECAVVRLTWSEQVEMQPETPAFEIFATFDDWVQERMLPDYEIYRTQRRT